MTHLSSREIDGMNGERQEVEELREEMLQLRAQQA